MSYQATILLEADLELPEKINFVSGQAVLYSHKSPDKITVNEDAVGLIPYDKTSGVIIVADGLGGERAGNEASRLAIEKIRSAISQAAAEETTLREAILDGIEQANQAVIDLGLGAATTLALAEINQQTVRPYHVGDSMILITGQRGKVKFEAIAHSPVGYAIESGMMDAAEAVLHEERHVVSNVIGEADMRIEIGPVIPLALHDTVVVASDGLADNLYTDEIIELVRKGSLDAAAATLLTRVQHRMQRQDTEKPSKPDDLSFILFREK